VLDRVLRRVRDRSLRWLRKRGLRDERLFEGGEPDTSSIGGQEHDSGARFR
jgi:hypothetical protein